MIPQPHGSCAYLRRCVVIVSGCAPTTHGTDAIQRAAKRHTGRGQRQLVRVVGRQHHSEQLLAVDMAGRHRQLLLSTRRRRPATAFQRPLLEGKQRHGHLRPRWTTLRAYKNSQWGHFSDSGWDLQHLRRNGKKSKSGSKRQQRQPRP